MCGLFILQCSHEVMSLYNFPDTGDMAATKDLSELCDELEDLTQCEICLNRSQSPIVLPCQHFFCYGCLSTSHLNNIKRGQSTKGKIKCPKCRSVHGLPSGRLEDLPKDHRTNKLDDILKIYKEDKLHGILYCTICRGTKTKERSKANEYCITCYELLCGKCSRDHKKLSSTRGHVQATLENEAIDFLLCPDHDERLVRHFCTDDTTAICNVCTHTTHKGHSVVDFVSTDRTDVKSRRAICNYLDRSLQELINSKTNLQQLRITRKTDLERTKKTITRRMWDLVERVQAQERSLHELIDEQYHVIKDQTSKLEGLIDNATKFITDLRETSNKTLMPLGHQKLTSAEFPTSWLQERITETEIPSMTLDWVARAGNFIHGEGQIPLGSVEPIDVPPGHLDAHLPEFNPDENVDTSICLLWEIKAKDVVDLSFVDDGAPGLLFTEVRETKSGDVFNISKVDLEGSKLQLPVPIPDCSHRFCALGINAESTEAIVLTKGKNNDWDTVTIKKDHISCVVLTSKSIRPEGQPVAMAINASSNVILATLGCPESHCGPTSVRCYDPDGQLLWCQNTTDHASRSTQQHLSTPWSICVDPLDRIIVADMNEGCVKIFDHKGNHLQTIHPNTCMDLTPCSVCVNNMGEIYVAYYDQNLVSKFTANGQFIQNVVRTKSKPKAISVRQNRLAVATEHALYMYKLENI